MNFSPPLELTRTAMTMGATMIAKKPRIPPASQFNRVKGSEGQGPNADSPSTLLFVAQGFGDGDAGRLARWDDGHQERCAVGEDGDEEDLPPGHDERQVAGAELLAG